MTDPSDPIDDIASMFLSPGGPASSPPPGAGAIELLLMGHLPVRAHVWLAPYADQLAREAGPTALVRLDSAEPSILVLRAVGELTVAEPYRNLREAILDLDGEIRLWLVSLPAPIDFEQVLRCRADRVTILSSVDDLAVTEAYLLLRSMEEAAQRAAMDVPSVGLGVMGAGREQAAEVSGKIHSIASERLGIAVPLVACVPRIDAASPASGWHYFAGVVPPELDDVVAWIRQARSRPGPRETAAEIETFPAGRSVPGAPAGATPGFGGGSPAAAPSLSPPPPTRPEGEPAGGSAGVSRGATGASSESEAGGMGGPGDWDASDSDRVKMAPKAAGFEAVTNEAPPAPAAAVSDDAPAAPPAAPPDTLAFHVPGLSPIPARCPGHEAIELAVDDRGDIHLLGRESNLRQMHHVAAWVRAHRDLLALAYRDRQFADSPRVVWRVFTEDALSVADLHDSDVHLHLLTPVVVEDRRGWYAAALNRPGG